MRVSTTEYNLWVTSVVRRVVGHLMSKNNNLSTYSKSVQDVGGAHELIRLKPPNQLEIYPKEYCQLAIRMSLWMVSMDLQCVINSYLGVSMREACSITIIIHALCPRGTEILTLVQL